MASALSRCAPTSNEASTVTVTDGYNRSVDVPENVESVATVGSGACFVVYAGAQDKLAAVTEKETESSPARPYTVVSSGLFGKVASCARFLWGTMSDVGLPLRGLSRRYPSAPLSEAPLRE